MNKTYVIPGLMCTSLLFSKIKLDNTEYLELPNSDNIDEIVNLLHIQLKNENKINIIGFSFGGYIALRYAIKHSNQVNKVLVISSGIENINKKEIESRQKLLQDIEKHSISNLSTKAVKALLEDKNNQDNINTIKNMFKSLGIETYKLQIKASMQRESLYTQLLKSNISALFLNAKDDKLVNNTTIKELCKHKNNFSINTLDTSSHMIPLEYPSFLYNTVHSFFKN